MLEEELSYIEDVAVANGWDRVTAKSSINKIEGKIYKEELQKLWNPLQFEREKR
jgi:hypothetical protein